MGRQNNKKIFLKRRVPLTRRQIAMMIIVIAIVIIRMIMMKLIKI